MDLGLLLELGVDSLDELDELLAGLDTDAVNEKMDYRYPAGAVRRLDDALLARFGDRYVGLTGQRAPRRPAAGPARKAHVLQADSRACGRS